MPMRRSRHATSPASLAALLLVLLAACGSEPAADAPEGAVASAPPAAAAADAPAAGGPPPGRYVCRQYTTTMGYLTLTPGGEYEVSGVRGRYAYDPGTGAVDWQGGSYDEWNWDGTYEHVSRPEGDGRPDEEVIRLVGRDDGLRIDCFRMAEE